MWSGLLQAKGLTYIGALAPLDRLLTLESRTLMCVGDFVDRRAIAGELDCVLETIPEGRVA